MIVTMWPSLDKETVLSKIITNVDTFRINLSHGDEDTKKKYIDMVLKLDSSKSIMLDTRGPEVRTRNKEEIYLEQGQIVNIEHAEFFKDSMDVLYIDYGQAENIPTGTIIDIDNETVLIEVIESKEWYIVGKVTKEGLVLINRHIDFDGYIPELPYLWEKDKRHIIWWIDHKINMISVSYIKSWDNIREIKSYLESVNWWHIKVIAKVETQDGIQNLKEIIEASDGIILNPRKLSILSDEKTAQKVQEEAIRLCHTIWKPVVLNIELNMADENDQKKHLDIVRDEIKNGIDTFMLTKATAIAEDPIQNIIWLFETINHEDVVTRTEYTLDDVTIWENTLITDYIVYDAYRASKEIPIKAIICPTESWYTPARLSGLKPDVPIIAFTKSDEAYRYLNLMHWVKWYKIAPTFDYTNIKQIGKEIIRILFKWNISLDDKILIVHSSLEQNKAGMINGMELYKFKDI